jgi:hypothetical protein
MKTLPKPRRSGATACAWAVLALSLLAMGCTPALNWREVPLTASPLLVLLPCKADTAEREVTLSQQRWVLHMVGCEAQGNTYAVAHIKPGQAAQAAEVLTAWRAATLAAWGQPKLAPMPAPALQSLALPGHGRVAAQGHSPNGQVLAAQAAWWVRLDGSDAYVVQAVVVGERSDPNAADTFFAGLRLP